MKTLPKWRACARGLLPLSLCGAGLLGAIGMGTASLSSLAADEGPKALLTVERGALIRTLSDPRVSPDGTRVAFVVSEPDLARNARIPGIWVAPTDGRGPVRPYTAAGADATSPRWSPDGAWLAFLSSRPAGPSPARGSQVFVLPTAGGEARRVTRIENGVREFEWSPDGTRFVCVARAGPPGAPPAAEDGAPVFRRYTRSSFKKDGAGYADGLRSHLFVVEVAGGGARQITHGEGWDDLSPRWSPDGTRIAFVSDRSSGPGEFETWKSDVWVVPAAGGEPERVTTNPFVDAAPEWSPDGTKLAWLGHPAESDYARLCVAPAAARGVGMEACVEVPFYSFSLQWAEEGKALYVDAADKGDFRIVRYGVAERTHRPLTAAGRAARDSHLQGETGLLAYRASTPTRPDEIHVLGGDGVERRLSDLHGEALAGLALGEVERFTFPSVDGWTVEGFLMRPSRFDPSRRYPLVLAIHGGPGGMYAAEWSTEFQLYAAHGYGVLFLNPRGSSGYGRAFQRGVEREWGGKAYLDLMAGVDAALARHPWLHPGRLVVTGASYGGFMTNWIVTRTGRFKAAVSLAGLSNMVSVQGTRDMPYSHRLDFGGDLYQSPELYWRYSPVQYAARVNTPILLVHGERDMRVPLEQAEQFFRALKLHGKTAELMVLPRASHALLGAGPREMVEVSRARLEWFERGLSAAGVAP